MGCVSLKKYIDISRQSCRGDCKYSKEETSFDFCLDFVQESASGKEEGYTLRQRLFNYIDTKPYDHLFTDQQVDSATIIFSPHPKSTYILEIENKTMKGEWGHRRYQ